MAGAVVRLASRVSPLDAAGEGVETSFAKGAASVVVGAADDASTLPQVFHCGPRLRPSLQQVSMPDGE